MEYNEALQFVEKNLHLIGKKDKGATIEELILVPTNAALRDDFLKLYLRTLDGNLAIQPYIGADVDIVAVFDKKRIVSQGVFFHTNILNLPDNLEVITE